jgi:hypothetical protein
MVNLSACALVVGEGIHEGWAQTPTTAKKLFA